MRRFCRVSLAIAPAIALSIPTIALADPIVRTATGRDPGSIQSTVDAFRSDLGGVNNGIGGSFPTGRREINWDGVPAEFSAPNALPPDFFNVNSPRGLVYTTPGEGFQVSANAESGIPVEFGNINPTYSSIFKVFSPQKLFTPIGSTISEQIFYIPGTNKRATVSGFGAVFTDVDRKHSTRIEFYDVYDNLIYSAFVPNVRKSNETLSFLGVSFKKGERIYRVVITSGNTPLSPKHNDGRVKNRKGFWSFRDLVVMDDFIYGEPQAVGDKYKAVEP
jgi:hypothetical protein